MKLSGKKNGYNKDVLLKEVAIICNISELDKIIDFLTRTRNDLVKTPNFSHEDVLSLGEDTISPHRHIQDWDKNWKNPDIAVYVPFKAKKNEDGTIIWEDVELS